MMRDYKGKQGFDRRRDDSRKPDRKQAERRPEPKEPAQNAVRENAVAGRNPIYELLRSGRTIEKLYVAKDEKPEGSAIKILAMAREKGVVIVEAGRRKLEEMGGTSAHQGMVAITTEYRYYTLDDLFAVPEEKGEKPFFIVLDGVSDPGNLGAILRTADACGVHGVIVPKRGSCGMTATVIKASAGASEYVRVCKVTNIAETISALQKRGVWVYGTSGEAEKEIYDTDLTGAVAIVLGDEGKGISPLVEQRCDVLMKIPMRGHVNSLNVSVAGAVTLYEAVKQRLK